MKIIVLSLISFNLILAFELKERCRNTADLFGTGVGQDSISDECLNLYMKGTSEQKMKLSPDKSLSIYGYENLVVIQDAEAIIDQRKNIILGEYTNISEVQAVAIDTKNNEIIVLDKKAKILFFSKMITGNIAPYREINNSELLDTNDIAINEDHGVVIVLNSFMKTLLFFKRKSQNKEKDNPFAKLILDTNKEIKGIKIDPKKSLKDSKNLIEKYGIQFYR